MSAECWRQLVCIWDSTSSGDHDARPGHARGHDEQAQSCRSRQYQRFAALQLTELGCRRNWPVKGGNNTGAVDCSIRCINRTRMGTSALYFRKLSVPERSRHRPAVDLLWRGHRYRANGSASSAGCRLGEPSRQRCFLCSVLLLAEPFLRKTWCLTEINLNDIALISMSKILRQVSDIRR